MSSIITKLKAHPVIAWIVIAGGTLLIGVLGGLLGGSEGFDTLVKPPLTPPAWVFPVVWSILFLLMGTAAWQIFLGDGENRELSLRLYVVQLIVNALWQLLFFRLEWRLFALIWILLLFALALATAWLFGLQKRSAGWLMAPYLLWIAFAAYLNFGFYVLNKV